MKSGTKNPWLNISAEDYEGHMSASNVMQLDMLNKIFANVINDHSSKSVLVLGCATGNGFEHLIGKNSEQIIGVDINPEYISICGKRFAEKLPQLKLICGDISDVNFPGSTFDLIHAALIFEYVNVDLILSKISKWLKQDGVLSVVLQLPSESSSPVSETQFQSLKMLGPIIKLIDPEKFAMYANKLGLKEIESSIIKLMGGKSFSVIKFVGRVPRLAGGAGLPFQKIK